MMLVSLFEMECRSVDVGSYGAYMGDNLLEVVRLVESSAGAGRGSICKRGVSTSSFIDLFTQTEWAGDVDDLGL